VEDYTWEPADDGIMTLGREKSTSQRCLGSIDAACGTITVSSEHRAEALYLVQSSDLPFLSGVLSTQWDIHLQVRIAKPRYDVTV
jgi:hypothetical protein